jgi:hypothetical protein
MDAETQQRIRELRSACGCKSGMVAMLVSVAAYVALAATGPGHHGLVHLALLGVAVALGGALVGKCAGLLWARLRLVLLLRRLSTLH